MVVRTPQNYHQGWGKSPFTTTSTAPAIPSYARPGPAATEGQRVTLQIGYKASAEQFGPRQLVELAVAAEAHGLDSVWVSDHFQGWRHTDGHAPFSLATLAAIGERTSRVLLGTSVLTPTFRYHPAVVAQAVATLGCLYPRRVRLGVGTGEALNEVAVTGIEWPPFPERFARLREAVELIRRLWREERVTFEGTYYRTVGATLYDRPPRPVPLYVAAGGPRMARYAGQVGDGLICTSGKGMALYEEQLLPAVAEGAAAAGRRRDDLDRMIEIKLSFDVDPERARQDTWHWAPLALSAEQKAGLADPVEMEAAGAALPLEQVVSRWIVTADPAEAVARIAPYVAAGFRHLVIHAPGPDQARFLAAFATHLLPQLRALA